MNILIVDDSKLLRDRIHEALLEIKNIEHIDEATNGVEALIKINEKKPNFIILDVRMPKMNGIAILEKIKSHDFINTICVFTNFPNYQYMKECIKKGADYFLNKNEDFEVLIDLIEQETQMHTNSGLHDIEN